MNFEIKIINWNTQLKSSLYNTWCTNHHILLIKFDQNKDKMDTNLVTYLHLIQEIQRLF